jgi:RimJ/RimL family protein N-acetyltransferase
MPKRTVPPVAGLRCKLRLITEADLPATLAWRNRHDVRRWFVFSDKLTWDQHLAWFTKYAERDDDFLFVIEETRTLQRPVGQISLYKVDWAAGSAEYGRILIGDPEAQGLGLAREATQLVLGVAFEAWGLRRVYLEVFKANERAIGVYQANGFRVVAETETMLRMEIMPAPETAAA